MEAKLDAALSTALDTGGDEDEADLDDEAVVKRVVECELEKLLSEALDRGMRGNLTGKLARVQGWVERFRLLRSEALDLAKRCLEQGLFGSDVEKLRWLAARCRKVRLPPEWANRVEERAEHVDQVKEIFAMRRTSDPPGLA